LFTNLPIKSYIFHNRALYQKC